jgi:hypothetical protein
MVLGDWLWTPPRGMSGSWSVGAVAARSYSGASEKHPGRPRPARPRLPSRFLSELPDGVYERWTIELDTSLEEESSPDKGETVH